MGVLKIEVIKSQYLGEVSEKIKKSRKQLLGEPRSKNLTQAYNGSENHCESGSEMYWC